MAHLLGGLERGRGAGADEHGILSWRSGQPLDAFEGNVRTLIRAAGELGCGDEASLEAWYRFLLDPKPCASLQRVPCRPGGTTTDCIGPSLDAKGEPLVDDQLLAQRAAFLRSDSLLVLVTLSDENDCSIRVGDQSWRVSSQTNQMPRGSSTCGENPNAACCYSCRGVMPEGCDADAQCKAAPLMTRQEDSLSLRCFDQKRRFGASFLYPTARYINALTPTPTLLRERLPRQSRLPWPARRQPPARRAPALAPGPRTHCGRALAACYSWEGDWASLCCWERS